MSIAIQLQSIILDDVMDYEIRGCNLLVTTKAKYPAMVDKLVKFEFASEKLASKAIELLNNMVEGA